MNCAQYFTWAKENEESIKRVVDKYRPQIMHHLKLEGSRHTDPMRNVLPQGDYVCDFCSKPFKHKTRLKKHVKLKHRRECEQRRNNSK